MNEEILPIDILLFCPNCGKQHIDQPQPELNWTNPPHRSHECHFCHWVWRPADVPTNGVEKILTVGKRDGMAEPCPIAQRRILANRAQTFLMQGDSLAVAFMDGENGECTEVAFWENVDLMKKGETAPFVIRFSVLAKMRLWWLLNLQCFSTVYLGLTGRNAFTDENEANKTKGN